MSQSLYIQTPLFENPIINARLNKRIFLKMECYQPSGSFKARGIGYKCKKAVEDGATYLISSSGGNAGYTAAYSGRILGVKVTVVMPESASEQARERIMGEGAELIVYGESFQEANTYALELVEKTGGTFIHPFDDPLVWQGYEPMAKECVEQAPIKPDVIVVAVGGAGLFSGLIAGMHHYGWEDIPVMALETRGAESLAKSLETGEHVTLHEITSIAATLGAKRVTSQAIDWSKKHEIISHVVSDKIAVQACLRFADDMRVVVEPACGAALSVLYDKSQFLDGYDNVLVIVCGGVGATYKELLRYQQELAD